MDILRDTIERCFNCDQCKTACRRLRFFEKRSPGDVAKAVLSEQIDEKVMDFIMKCSLCSLCNELCPYGVDIRGMVTLARNSLMHEGMIDQECYRHLWVDYDWNLFTLFRANYWLDITYQELVKKNCEVLFFPGCMLAHEGPDLVLHYKHLMVLSGDAEYTLHFNESDRLSASQQRHLENQYSLFKAWYAARFA
jgi:Fe-S oxidoreductase